MDEKSHIAMAGLTGQLDYLFIAVATCLMVASGECFVLASADRHAGWLRMIGFTLAHSFTFLARAVIPAIGSGPGTPIVVPALNSASFALLWWFALKPFPLPRRVRTLLAGTLLAAGVAVAVAGGILGESGLSAAGRLALGAPAGALAAAALLPRLRSSPTGRGALAVCVASLAAFAILNAASGISVIARPGADRAGIRLVDGALSLALTSGLVAFDLSSIRATVRVLRRPLPPIFTVMMAAVFPLLLGAGWLLTQALGSQAIAILGDEAHIRARLHAAIIGAMTAETDRTARLIAGSPAAVRCLEQPTPARQRELVSVLDGIRSAMPSSASWVADARGTIVAGSTPRRIPFPEARGAGPTTVIAAALGSGSGRTFRLDAATGLQSYQSASAVRDADGRVVGAAAVVRSAADAASLFGATDPLFLVDPAGVVFLSTREGAAWRPLWPPPGVATGAVDGLLPREVPDGGATTWEGVPHLLRRIAIVPEGWSIVFLLPLRRLFVYRLGGGAAAFILSTIVLGFAVVGKLNLLAAARLRGSETRYRTLVESAPDWVSIVDRDGTCRFVNQAGLGALGRAADEIVGGDLTRLCGEDAAGPMLGALAEAGSSGRAAFEAVITGPRGRRTWEFAAVALPAEAPHGGAVMLIGTDTTDRRDAETRLVRAERTAALWTFAAGIGHQFNNLTMAALGSLGLAQADADLPPRAAERLGAVRAALERESSITSRLLLLTAASASDGAGARLADAVRSAVTSASGDLARNGVSVQLDLRDDRPAAMDAGQLELVVETLLSNAWHAVLGCDRRQVRITTRTEAGWAALRVEDTGIGIPAERLGSIFTPFATDKGEHAPAGSARAAVRGIGLGLPIVQSLLASRGGSIDVASAPGAGTTVTVRVPCAEVES